jgi:hypothetical protein
MDPKLLELLFELTERPSIVLPDRQRRAVRLKDLRSLVILFLGLPVSVNTISVPAVVKSSAKDSPMVGSVVSVLAALFPSFSTCTTFSSFLHGCGRCMAVSWSTSTLVFPEEELA